MKLDVPRDVINDLWPLCRTEDASTDSQALVRVYLEEDEPFAEMLSQQAKQAGTRTLPALEFSPDSERRLLDDARRHARMKLMVIGGVIVMAAFIVMIALVARYFLCGCIFRMLLIRTDKKRGPGKPEPPYPRSSKS